jgi:hypothetical protein
MLEAAVRCGDSRRLISSMVITVIITLVWRVGSTTLLVHRVHDSTCCASGQGYESTYARGPPPIPLRHAAVEAAVASV